MKLSGNFGTPIEIEREELQDTHINLVGVLNYECPMGVLWVCDLWVS